MRRTAPLRPSLLAAPVCRLPAYFPAPSSSRMPATASMTSNWLATRAPWRTAIVAAGLLGLCQCGPTPAPPPPVSLTLATGGQGGAFYQLGRALSRLYSERLPGVTARFEPGGSGPNVDALEQGRVQIAFAQADVAYAAYRRGTGPTPQPHTSLRGIAVLLDEHGATGRCPGPAPFAASATCAVAWCRSAPGAAAVKHSRASCWSRTASASPG